MKQENYGDWESFLCDCKDIIESINLITALYGQRNENKQVSNIECLVE